MMTARFSQQMRDAWLLLVLGLATCSAFSNPGLTNRINLIHPYFKEISPFELQRFISTEIPLVDTDQQTNEFVFESDSRALKEYPSGYNSASMKSNTKQLSRSRTNAATEPLKVVSNKICSLFGVDRNEISNLGVTFALSYSALSQINGAINLSAAWYLSCTRTGLSPLAPGQWKSLLRAYGSIYAIVQLLRPFRMAAAVAGAKLSANLLQRTQNQLDCSRGFAIAIQYVMGWVAGGFTAACGITTASLFSGVPLWTGLS